MLLNKEKDDQEKFGLDRLFALTDGVIAIALTLLVLGIDIPEDHNFTEDGLKLFLIKLEPGLIAYTTSFIIIAMYWKMHHRIYNIVKRSNTIVFMLNLLFLFSISLIPFIAKIKSLYPYDILVVNIYAIAHIITGLILFFTWKYFMAHEELLKYSITKHKNNVIALSIFIIPVISLLAIFCSLINIQIATYLFLLIPVFYITVYKLYLTD